MADVVSINGKSLKDTEARAGVVEAKQAAQSVAEDLAATNREISKVKDSVTEAAARANEAYKKAEAATGTIGDLVTMDQVIAKLKYSSTVPTSVDVGGIPKGTVFTNESILDIIDRLLHPYIAFSLGSITLTPKAGVKELGTSVVLTEAKVSITQGTEKAVYVELLKDGEVIESMSGDEIGESLIDFAELSTVITDDAEITVRVTDNKGSIKTAPIARYTFAAPYFRGVCSAGKTFTSADVLALTKDLSVKAQKAYTYEMDNSAAVIAYPASYGALTRVLDQNNFNVTDSFIEQQVDVTSSAGTTTKYRVYVLANNNTATMQYTFIM